MYRALVLLWLLLAPAPPEAAEARCPAGAELIGYAPPDGDAWACVLRDQSGQAVPHGWHVEYWPNGTMKVALEFEQGERHGRFSQWSEDGQLVARGRYDGGERAGYWWYWGVLERGLYDPDGALARAYGERVLGQVGVDEADVPALTEFGIEQHQIERSDIRAAPQVCAPSACVSAAMIGERTVLAVQLNPPEDKVSASARELARVASEADAVHDQIEQAQKKRDRAFERAQKKYEKKLRSWDYTSLRCMDGTRSPSCICGGNWQGCCSHHGGVEGCPRELPEAPTPDSSPLIPNELVETTEDVEG